MKSFSLHYALSLQEISAGFRYNRYKVVRITLQEIDISLGPIQLTIMRIGTRWVLKTKRPMGRNEEAPLHH